MIVHIDTSTPLTFHLRLEERQTMTDTLTHQIANELIRDRTMHRTAMQRPTHRRTARALRGMADRLDARS
jgi:hypothetical protein